MRQNDRKVWEHHLIFQVRGAFSQLIKPSPELTTTSEQRHWVLTKTENLGKVQAEMSSDANATN
jgi:hypothetical protein